MNGRALLVLLSFAVLAACNTVQGVGRDVSIAGQTVSDSDVQDRF